MSLHWHRLCEHLSCFPHARQWMARYPAFTLCCIPRVSCGSWHLVQESNLVEYLTFSSSSLSFSCSVSLTPCRLLRFHLTVAPMASLARRIRIHAGGSVAAAAAAPAAAAAAVVSAGLPLVGSKSWGWAAQSDTKSFCTFHLSKLGSLPTVSPAEQTSEMCAETPVPPVSRCRGMSSNTSGLPLGCH